MQRAVQVTPRVIAGLLSALLLISLVVLLSGRLLTPATAQPAQTTSHSSAARGITALPASRYDYEQGYRAGYRDGFSDARQYCKSRHSERSRTHRNRLSDWIRGYDAGYPRGYSAGERQFCRRPR